MMMSNKRMAALWLFANYNRRFGSRRPDLPSQAHGVAFLEDLIGDWPSGARVRAQVKRLRRGGTRFSGPAGRGPRPGTRGLNRLAEVVLATLIAGGDPRAIEEFDRRYRTLIEALIRSEFGSFAERLDGFLDRLLVPHKGRRSKFASFRGKSTLTTWILVIARRELIDQQRARDRELDLWITAGGTIGLVPPAGGGLGEPADEADLRELRQTLEQSIAKGLALITPLERSLLTLIFVLGQQQQHAGRQLFGDGPGGQGPAVTKKKRKILERLQTRTAGLRLRDPEAFDRLFFPCLSNVLRRWPDPAPVVRDLLERMVKARIAQSLDVLTTRERSFLLLEVDLKLSIEVVCGLSVVNPVEERQHRAAFASLEKIRQHLGDDDLFLEQFRSRPVPTGGYLWLAEEVLEALR